MALDPLAVSPTTLCLPHDLGSPLRAASFTLRNNTDDPLDVTVIASQRLIVKTTVALPPQSEIGLSLQVVEGDVAALDEVVRFAADRSQRVSWLKPRPCRQSCGCSRRASRFAA